ncbi:hypothetical protein EXS74_00660 [Candidatus Woesearchaeota archaeon]|nr:hypothetical protein [Candidatus Woesearchaeota archaeon]
MKRVLKIKEMGHRNKYEASREILQAIQRYRRIRPMFYRSNVYLHEQRVLALVNMALPFIQEREPGIDVPMLRAFAMTHDDLEMYYGEERAPHEAPDDREIRRGRALRSLNGRYEFEVNGMPAKIVQLRYGLQGDLESQVVKYADHFDNMGEAMHEVHAGNDLFREPLLFNVSALRVERTRLPQLTRLLDQGHLLFDVPELSEDILAQRKPYSPYDFWRSALSKNEDPYVRNSLVERKEYAGEREIRGAI